MIQAARGGVGFCQMPMCSVRQMLKRTQMVTVLKDYESDSVPMHVIWPADSPSAPESQAARGSLGEPGPTGCVGSGSRPRTLG